MLKEPEAPQRTDENDTRPVSGRGDDRLLLWCLVASIFINFGFGLWMNLADVYGTGRTQQDLKRTPLKIYHPPPVKKKPKPKPPKPKIPPKPIKMVQPPKPTPTPPRPTPPQHFTVGTHSTSHTAVVVEPPSVPTPPAPVAPVQQETTTAPAPPTPQPPPVVAPPAPPAPVYHAPPAPKPAPKPSNYQEVAHQDADVTGIDAPDPSTLSDPSQVTGPCVISYEVSETGRISGVRVKKSSGSHEFDQMCMEAVQKAHGVFAIQDHIPYAQRGEQTFSQ